MPLMNDRPRIPVRPPRPAAPGRLHLLPAAVAEARKRLARPEYAPFVAAVEDACARAARLDLESSALSERQRAAAAKALALRAWSGRSRPDAARARAALLAAGNGPWDQWCGTAETVMDYLAAADLLRAAGRFSPADTARLRERIAPKLVEGVAVAPELPQNNWRIECDCAVAMGALFFWHNSGSLDCPSLLAASLDGLSRMIHGLVTPDGAYEEGINYSRRAFIPLVRLAWAYRRMSGADILSLPAVRAWRRWQVEMKAPDGRAFPLDDGSEGFEGFPHALLANPGCRDASLHRWAHERAGAVNPDWAAEAVLLFDHRVPPRRPSWPASRVLPRSGVAIFRSGWTPRDTMMVLVAKPFSPFGSDQINTAHKHDDPGHFVLYSGGEMLVTEGGYGRSYGDPQRYDYFLAGLAHNMILVDGRGPARLGSWNSDSREGNTSQSAGRVTELCRARGLYGARAETSYRDTDLRRSVFFVRRRYFVIVDEVSSAREHEYAWTLHGNSKNARRIENDGAQWIVGGRRLSVFHLTPSGMPWRFSTARGTAGDFGHGSRVTDHTMLRVWTAGRKATFVTVLIPDADGAESPEAALVSRDPVTVRVRLSGARESDLFFWDLKGRGSVARIRKG